MKKTNSYWAYLLGLVLVLLAAPVVSHADTIYGNFGAGNSYNCCSGWTVSGSSSTVGAVVVSAEAFTPSSSYDLTQILIAISNVSGTNQAYVTLNADSGSDTPGTMIESWSLSGLPNFGTNNSPETLTSSPGVLLTSGTQYWIVVWPDNSGLTSDTWDAWNNNSLSPTPASGTFSQSNDGVTWPTGFSDTQGAFEVDGTSPTPEPGTFGLLGLGLAALPYVRSRLRARRRG